MTEYDPPAENTPAPVAPEPAPEQATVATAKLKVNPIVYTGTVSALYGLWLKKLFLSMFTLGIYSFWGKTNIRRYLATTTKLGNDSFEYLGTGKELFIGMLKFLPFYLVFAFSFSFLQKVAPALIFVIYPLIFFFIHAVQYSALRYRMNRITWRGVRGRMGGSALAYGLYALKGTVLKFITFGWLNPKVDTDRFAYMMRNCAFGNVPFEFKPDHRGLNKLNMLTLLMPVFFILLAIFLGAAHAAFADMAFEPDTPNANMVVAKPNPLPAIIGLLAMISSIGRLWYHAALKRNNLRCLKLGDLRFRSPVTGGDYLRFMLANICILIFTLGIGMPFIISRNQKFMTRMVQVGGDLDSFTALQAERKKAGLAEGIGDVLGVDAGIDLGAI